MKRFSIFCAALFVAVTSFATVAYELNGGVTNDYGWMDKGDSPTPQSKAFRLPHPAGNAF